MVLPRGWWLQDRRSDAALFTAPQPDPPAAVYRPRRRRRAPAEPAPLPLDEGTSGAAAAPPDASWVPEFDAGDDLGGLLAATTPLLARAFRQDQARPQA